MNILTLTPSAAEHIQRLLSKAKNAVGFRISVKQTGCTGYMYMPEIIEKINDQDVKQSTEFNIDVYIDPACVKLITGTEIDFVTKKFGLKQLEFRNPNVESLCGCGESFNIKE